jgi:hypothetical protein
VQVSTYFPCSHWIEEWSNTMVRISAVEPLDEFNLRVTLTDGRIIDGDVRSLLKGKHFEPILQDSRLFKQVEAVDGSIQWPIGADLCPDVIICGGPPPIEQELPELSSTAQSLRR